MEGNDTIKTNMKSILLEALQVTDGERKLNYGSPTLNHERIARLWKAHLWAKYGVEYQLSPSDVCWMMLQVKQARHMHKPKRDNLVDVVGYARCISRIEKFEK